MRAIFVAMLMALGIGLTGTAASAAPLSSGALANNTLSESLVVEVQDRCYWRCINRGGSPRYCRRLCYGGPPIVGPGPGIYGPGFDIQIGPSPRLCHQGWSSRRFAC